MASVGAWHEVTRSGFQDFEVAQGLALGVSLREAVGQVLNNSGRASSLGHVQALFLVSENQSGMSPCVQPTYALDEAGRVRLIGQTADDVSLQSILAASDLGYNGWHSGHCLVVNEEAPGYGGNGHVITDFSLFLQFLAPALLDYLVGYTATRVPDEWNGVRYSKQRQLAWFWRESQGIANAQELRTFIDLMPDRRPRVVARRLALPKSAARELLLSLGYEKDIFTGIWELSSHPRLSKRRKKWLRHEQSWFPPPSAS